MNLQSMMSAVTGTTPSVYGSRPMGVQPSQSNVIKGSYTGGYKLNGLNLIVGKSLEKYMNRMDELDNYLESSVTRTILDIISDTVSELFTTTTDIITLEGLEDEHKFFEEELSMVNNIFNHLHIGKHIKTNLRDIIYYGSYSFHLQEEVSETKGDNIKTKTGVDDDGIPYAKIKKNTKRAKYKLRYLKEPHKVISVWKDNQVQSYITPMMNGDLAEFTPGEIVSITTADFTLDIDEHLYEDDLRRNTTDELGIKSYDKMYLGGTPLYNDITYKVKEYVLKDYLLSILSIKDLIQPLILLLGLEKTTSLSDGYDLTQKVEELINRNVDMSFLESKNLSIKQLAQSLIDNIRVIPDYDNKLAMLQDLSLDRVNDKIDRMRADQGMVKEDIIGSTGMPYELFEGRATRWEAIKTSQRFTSKINYYSDSINNSLVHLAEYLFQKLTDVDFGKIKGKIKCNLVNKSILTESNNFNMMESMLEQASRLADLSDLIERTTQSSFISQPRLREYLRNALGKIDGSMQDLIKTDEEIKAEFESQQEQQQMYQ